MNTQLEDAHAVLARIEKLERENHLYDVEPARFRYANFFNIGHDHFEVVLDCGQFIEGAEKPQMHTRILMSPVYVTSLLNLFPAVTYEK